MSWELYWITRLEGIKFTLGALVCFTLVATVILGWFLITAIADHEHDIEQSTKKPFLVSLSLLLTFWLMFVFCPTTREMVLIKVVPPLINSEVTQRIPNDMSDVYNWAVKEIKAMTKEEAGR